MRRIVSQGRVWLIRRDNEISLVTISQAIISHKLKVSTGLEQCLKIDTKRRLTRY